MGSKSGADPELDFEDLNYLLHVKSFLTLLFAIGNIAVWRPCPVGPLNPTLLKIPIDKKGHLLFCMKF